LGVKESLRGRLRGDSVNRIKGRVAGMFGAYGEKLPCVMNYGRHHLYGCIHTDIFMYMYIYS
jgi:hypothetical protein